MTTSAFPPLTAAEQIFKDLIWQPLVVGGETWLTGIQATVPVLDLPIFATIEDDIIGAFSDGVYAAFVQWIDVTTITLVDEQRQAAYAAACEQLSVILIEKGSTSVEYQIARDAALAAQATFTQFNGS